MLLRRTFSQCRPIFLEMQQIVISKELLPHIDQGQSSVLLNHKAVALFQFQNEVGTLDGHSALSRRQQVEKSTMSLFIDESHNSQSISQSSQEVKPPETRLLVAQTVKMPKAILSTDLARVIIRQQHRHLLQCLQIATVSSLS